jgi:hypothetical protein
MSAELKISKEARTEKLREVLLHSHQSPKSIDINTKVKIINDVVEITINDAAQGSKEWVSERQIGGSDISSVMGHGYGGKDFFSVVCDKIFGSQFYGNLATRFGRVMEEVSRKLVEKLFGATVWELKSLPNQLKYTSYSPDGVAVANILGKYLMLLLEFKTPLSRIPDGKIPKEYLPQIKAGMCAIPIVDGSLFVNSMLRICNLYEVKYNFEYNTLLHKADCTTCKSRPYSNKSKIDQVCAIGISVLVQNEMQLAYANQQSSKPIDNSHYKDDIIRFKDEYNYEDDLLRSASLSSSEIGANADRAAEFRIQLAERYENKQLIGTDAMFIGSLLHENERDYGSESDKTIDTILEHVDNKLMLDVFHIPPYIVRENLGKAGFLKECGFKQSNVDPDQITVESRLYLLDSMNYLREELKKQNVRIVGVLPYKIFKMDLIYQDNNDPEFIRKLKPLIDIYEEIKLKCNKIDATEKSIEERDRKKWDIIYEHFPNKKQNKPVADDSITLKLDDDSMF